MSKNFNFLLIFLVFVFLSCSDTNQESNNSGPITIAGVFHMSGPFAFIGELGKTSLAVCCRSNQ